VLLLKIGAGGLQSLAVHDLLSRQNDPAVRTKPVPDPLVMQNQQLVKNLLNQDLNRAVEQLNKLAQLLNQALEFELIKQDKLPRVRVKNKSKGQSYDLSPEEAVALLVKTDEAEEKTRGRHLDNYA